MCSITRISSFAVVLAVFAVACSSTKVAVGSSKEPMPPPAVDAASPIAKKVPVVAPVIKKVLVKASNVTKAREKPVLPKPTPIKRLGISIAIPEAAKPVYQGTEPMAVNLHIGLAQVLRIQKVAAVPPTSLSAAKKFWSSYIGDGRSLKEGTKPSGIFYSAFAITVRGGSFDSASGNNIHSLEDITRVAALVATGTKSFVTCYIYLEFGVKDATNAAVTRALDICLSMKPLASTSK